MSHIDVSRIPKNKRTFFLALKIVGGISEMSSILKVSKQLVYSWISPKRKSPIPDASYCELIEKATGGQVTKHDLRPDIFKTTKDIKYVSTPEQVLKKGIALINEAFLDLSKEASKGKIK